MDKDGAEPICLAMFGGGLYLAVDVFWLISWLNNTVSGMVAGHHNYYRIYPIKTNDTGVGVRVT